MTLVGPMQEDASRVGGFSEKLLNKPLMVVVVICAWFGEEDILSSSNTRGHYKFP